METINETKTKNNMLENGAGATGGILGVVTGSIIGNITFSGLAETAVYAAIGGGVGYFTVRFVKWAEKKIRKK